MYFISQPVRFPGPLVVVVEVIKSPASATQWLVGNVIATNMYDNILSERVFGQDVRNLFLRCWSPSRQGSKKFRPFFFLTFLTMESPMKSVVEGGGDFTRGDGVDGEGQTELSAGECFME